MPDPRVLQIADQFGHIALDLVCDAEAAVGMERLCFMAFRVARKDKPRLVPQAGFAVGANEVYRVRATSLTSKNSNWSPSLISL